MGRHSLRRGQLSSVSCDFLFGGLHSVKCTLLCFGLCTFLTIAAIPAEADPRPERQVVAGPRILNDEELSLSPEVEQYINLYSSPSGIDYIRRSLIAARPYRDFIFEALDTRRMPRELFYLALIESNFNPRAISRSGAVGLWQFMENSVEEWMRIEEWVDERRDFYRSTHAALEKLAHNFTVLDDWLLAIAAYNAGLGHIQRSIQAADSRDFWVLADSGLLPEQTVDYVPKFLAIAWIAEQAGRYDLTTDWIQPLRWTRVEVPAGTDLFELAPLIDSQLDGRTLHGWNVHLTTPHIPEETGGYLLNVPAEYKEATHRAVERIDTRR